MFRLEYDNMEGQQCYAPVLLPVWYPASCGQVPALLLPPAKEDSNTAPAEQVLSLPPAKDDSSECSRSVTDSAEDVGAQLDSAVTYARQWCEVEGNLFVRVFPLPLLSKCFIVSDDGDFRPWGTNSDIDLLFSVIGYRFRSIAIVRTTTMNVTDFTPYGERKIMHLQHGLRLVRAFPDGNKIELV